jgi:ABC-type Fe3+-siderophore transport system permease subunit
LRLGRELIIFGVALALGLVGVPLLIWVVGNRMLGPYTHGSDTHAGPLALLGDFFAGLGHGAVTFWIVALGPALLVAFVRVVYAFVKPPLSPNAD